MIRLRLLNRFNLEYAQGQSPIRQASNRRRASRAHAPKVTNRHCVLVGSGIASIDANSSSQMSVNTPCLLGAEQLCHRPHEAQQFAFGYRIRLKKLISNCNCFTHGVFYFGHLLEVMAAYAEREITLYSGRLITRVEVRRRRAR